MNYKNEESKFTIGDTFLVYPKEKVISIPSSMSEGDYPDAVKRLIEKGYKIQLNLL
jgi:hypothetical protein